MILCTKHATVPPMDIVLKGVERPSGLFRFELDGSIEVLVRVAIRDGNIDFSWMRVHTSEGDVTSDTLRSIPVGRLRVEIHERLKSKGEGGPALLDGRATLAQMYRGSNLPVPEHLAAAEERAYEAVSNLREAAPKGGPRSLPEGFWMNVALGYIDAAGSDPTRPVAHLAEELGSSRNTVADWVRKSRARGWLQKTKRGQTNANPGPRLIEYLESKQKEEKP